MSILFVLIGLASYLCSVLVIQDAKGVVQEIMGGIFGIVGTLFIIGGALVSELRRILKQLKEKQ